MIGVQNPLPVLSVRLGVLLLVMLALGVPSHAQHGGKGKDGDMEQFDEVCPYTKGERELEERLGYARFGLIPWRNGEVSSVVQENMGGIPMIWVETEHFRIGSSLGTYKTGKDKQERLRVKEEIGRLKKKLGKLRTHKKEIDPYLRLHIYAQRAEDLYESFVKDFHIEPEPLAQRGAHLGHKNKFLLLLCQRKSEYGRYIRTYEKAELPFSYRMGWRNDGMIVAVNMESISEIHDEDDLPFDTMLHCLLANSLASIFVDGFDQTMFKAPTWLVYGLAHIYSRRIDPHWPFFDARRASQINYAEIWDWVPRVQGLVKNEYYPSAEKMFAWREYGDLGARDHLVSWSKLEYLIEVAEGDHQLFLSLACKPLKPGTLAGVSAENEPVIRQTRALAAAFKMTPAELDTAWAKWVSKTYKKR